MKLTKTVEVGEGGRIVLDVPELQVGDVVQVQVTVPEPKKPRSRLLKKVSKMMGDFEELLPDFKDIA